jgi:hypothetical protein
LSNRGDVCAAEAIVTKALHVHRDRNLLVLKRLELELARLMVDSRPDRSFRYARDVADAAAQMGADPLKTQAKALLEEIELRGR